MTRLTRFLDWLDEAAAGFIRLAYLLAGITAVALYFGAGHLPAFVADPLNGVLPRAVFTPGMGTGELMRLSGVSKAAASKWRGILQAEADAAQQSNQAVQ